MAGEAGQAADHYWEFDAMTKQDVLTGFRVAKIVVLGSLVAVLLSGAAGLDERTVFVMAFLGAVVGAFSAPYLVGLQVVAEGSFRPCVIHHPELGLTEMLLEDTSIVWRPWAPYRGHAVDLGYGLDGRLVGIQIWDDVAVRRARSEHDGAEEFAA